MDVKKRLELVQRDMRMLDRIEAIPSVEFLARAIDGLAECVMELANQQEKHRHGGQYDHPELVNPR